MDRPVLSAGVLAVGMILAGGLVGWGFQAGRTADRYVTVKGMTEREVEADLALWPLQLVTADNDLATAQGRMDRMVERTRDFLVESGISHDQISIQAFRVQDAQANPYQGSGAANRFIITQTLMVRSQEPRVVEAASQGVSELVENGVVLTSGQEYGPGGPTFVFSRLNDVKSEMLAEATALAREAAAEFATASGSRVGKIRQANQGVFQILPRDQTPGIQEQNQRMKIVRVVTTIQYLLEG